MPTIFGWPPLNFLCKSAHGKLYYNYNCVFNVYTYLYIASVSACLSKAQTSIYQCIILPVMHASFTYVYGYTYKAIAIANYYYLVAALQTTTRLTELVMKI